MSFDGFAQCWPRSVTSIGVCVAYRLFNVAEPTPGQHCAKPSDMDITLKDCVREWGGYLKVRRVFGIQIAKEPGNPCCCWVYRLLANSTIGLTVRRSTD